MRGGEVGGGWQGDQDDSEGQGQESANNILQAKSQIPQWGCLLDGAMPAHLHIIRGSLAAMVESDWDK